MHRQAIGQRTTRKNSSQRRTTASIAFEESHRRFWERIAAMMWKLDELRIAKGEEREEGGRKRESFTCVDRPVWSLGECRTKVGDLGPLPLPVASQERKRDRRELAKELLPRRN